MIAKEHRFQGRGSLNYVYRQGRTVRTKTIALRFCPNKKRSSYRAAVVVSRKVHKSAVIRNRIRRRVYENVRILFAPAEQPYDLVFLVYDASIADMPAAELTRTVGSLLKKAQLQSAAPASRHIASVEPDV